MDAQAFSRKRVGETSGHSRPPNGREVDQWLVLMTAAVAMQQYDSSTLADEIYRGILGSPWSQAPATLDLGRARE